MLWNLWIFAQIFAFNFPPNMMASLLWAGQVKWQEDKGRGLGYLPNIFEACLWVGEAAAADSFLCIDQKAAQWFRITARNRNGRNRAPSMPRGRGKKATKCGSRSGSRSRMPRPAQDNHKRGPYCYRNNGQLRELWVCVCVRACVCVPLCVIWVYVCACLCVC